MLAAIKNINLGLRFILELCLLAAFAYWGYQYGSSGPLQVLAGTAAAMVIAVLWGLFLSPKAKIKLPLAIRVLMELSLFCMAGWLLYGMGRYSQAMLLVIVFVLNRAILLAVKA